MMPEPTTIASSRTVPRNSAAAGRQSTATSAIRADIAQLRLQRHPVELVDRQAGKEADALGQMWTMADRFNRQAIFPLADTWNGEYPFESPSVSGLGGAANFYLPLPDGLHQHALHLHRLVRSPHDGVVYRRLEKQFQYSMVPVTVPREGRLENEWKSLLS